MNKVLVGVISSLATLGLVGGAGAIALSSPNVKENLSVSFGQSDLMGNNISANNKKIQELSNELAEKNMLLIKQQDEMFNLTNQVDELNEDKLQYKIQIANLKGDNANLTSEINTLNNQVTIANNKVTTLENRVSNYQTQITNLRNTNTRLNENISNLRSEKMQLQDELSNKEMDLQMLNDELEILRQDYESNIQQIQELESAISSKENEVQELNSQIMSKQMTIYDLQAEVESYSIRISEFENEIANANSEIARLNSEIQVLNNDIQYMSNQIVTNNETITELTTSIAIKDEEILTLQSNLEELNNTINTLNTDISNLQVSIEELNNKVNYYETALGSNYIIVNYIVDGVENPRVQKKWSMSEFTAPNKSGYEFLGWSYTENGETLISGQSFSTSVDLYAVYKRNPTIEDFDNYIDINEYTGYCWNSSDGGDYEGIYRYNKQGPSCYRVYPKYYDWKLLLNADNKVLIFCHEEQNKTLELELNSAVGCVEIASQSFDKYHILSDKSVYMYNDNYHLLYNVATTNIDVRGTTDGNVYNTLEQLESGNYIFGSSLETTTNICHFNMETRAFTTIYESGSAWGDIYEFKDNAPLIFSRDGENANGFIKFDESTMTSDFYEVENCGRVECIWQLDYTLENFLIRFNNCMIVFDGENKEVRNVEYDNSLQVYNQFSLENFDYMFCSNDGIYLFSKADETVSKIGDIGRVVEHSEYDVTGNCLLVTETSEKYVYIANTKTIEEFDENKDYTSYIGENNE